MNKFQKPAPRVVVLSLASCFGCQINITNVERYLLDVVGQIDLTYWQLTSSVPEPEEYDVAIIEGAVSTAEAEAVVKRAREIATKVIAIGACACTGGIPGMAARNFEACAEMYDGMPGAAGEVRVPRPVSDFITVDHSVYACPIEPMDFIDVLHQALYGTNRYERTGTMCGSCKLNGTKCLFAKGQMCLGLVTRGGCNAKCVNLGRACNGCRGLSPDANLVEARKFVASKGYSVEAFDQALEMFNQVNPKFAPEVAAAAAGQEA